MKSFSLIYNILPSDTQRVFKSEVCKACHWKTEDLFYKKMNGKHSINPLEDEKLTALINNRYKAIIELAEKISELTTELKNNAI